MSRVEHLERHVDDLRLILAMKQDEIERLREALQELLNVTPNFPPEGNLLVGMEERYNKALIEARSALQQKGTE